MSRISSVLKNRNRVEREDKQRKTAEIQAMKAETAYRAKLYEDMQVITTMFKDSEVEEVRIVIPPNSITQFMKAMYSEGMADYQIQQDGDSFIIRRRVINF